MLVSHDRMVYGTCRAAYACSRLPSLARFIKAHALPIHLPIELSSRGHVFHCLSHAAFASIIYTARFY